MEKLRQRWGLKSNWGILAIIIAFSINGSFASFIAKPILYKIGFTQDAFSPWIFWPVRILTIFFVYQFTLPFSGWLVGQYAFFKEMQHKMLVRMKLKKA